MSSVLSAKTVCERALRAIGAFPVTDSSADGEQLREAMLWLDLLLAENAGTDRLFFLVPATVSFTLANGTAQYDLLDALGADAPIDGVQFPVAAYLVEATGSSNVGFNAAIPGTIAVGQTVTNLTTPANIPPGATVAAINPATNQITLSGPSTVATNDVLQFGSSPVTTLTASGTINGAGMIAGTIHYTRHPVDIVKRDQFMREHRPQQHGHPRMVYIDRLPDNQLYLHPYPSPTDPVLFILQLDVQTYAPNVAPAGVTGTQPQGAALTKFRQAWQRYLVFQLSGDLGSGPIYKLPQASITNFYTQAAIAKDRLEAFENREHDDVPPICEPHDHDFGWHDPYFEDRIRRY